MRLPHRPKQLMKRALQRDEPLYLTAEKIAQMKRRLTRIEDVELPQAIEDVRRTGEFGDFSENAEYQEAKGRMRRLHAQVTRITEELKVAIVIESPEGSDVVQLGSVVGLTADDGVEQRYQIVGPQEANPVQKKLSFKSPLGAVVMGRSLGEHIEFTTPSGVRSYQITFLGS